MPKNTIRFDDNKWYTYGRALKAFAAATVLAVSGWQFAKWWQNPIDHEAIKPFNDHVMIGNVKVSDPFAVMFNHMGVREGEGATLGTQTVVEEALEETIKLPDQIDPRTQAREAEAKSIMESYERFLQTQAQPIQKYKFLGDSMMRMLGTNHHEGEQLGPHVASLFQLFRQAARDAFAEVRLQALRDPNFDYYDALRWTTMDSFNSSSDPDSEKYWKMHADVDKEISGSRSKFKPAP